MAEQNHFALQGLTEKVIGCAYAVYNQLGCGFLESVYERSMLVELELAGLNAVAQYPLDVHYRGRPVGKFFADIVVNGVLIVEIKACDAIATAHESQLVNYLTATGIDVGLIINFGPAKVTVRRKVRDLSTLPPRSS